MISEHNSHRLRYNIKDDFDVCIYPLPNVCPTPKGAKALTAQTLTFFQQISGWLKGSNLQAVTSSKVAGQIPRKDCKLLVSNIN